MSYTLSDLTTKVQSKIKDTGFSSSLIQQFLNEAQWDLFNEYHLPAMEATQDYTLTIGNSDITTGVGLPTDYVGAIDLLVTYRGFETLLPYQDIKDVDTLNPDSTDTTAYANNPPQYWYKFGDTLRVFPAPNAAYTVTLRYEKTPTEMTADADVPDVPVNFREYLILGASARVHEVKDNYDIATVLFSRADTLASKLVAKYSQKQTGQPHLMRINRMRGNAPGF